MRFLFFRSTSDVPLIFSDSREIFWIVFNLPRVNGIFLISFAVYRSIGGFFLTFRDFMRLFSSFPKHLGAFCNDL